MKEKERKRASESTDHVNMNYWIPLGWKGMTLFIYFYLYCMLKLFVLLLQLFGLL